MANENDKFYLDIITAQHIIDDAQDQFNYDEVSVEESTVTSVLDEDLERAVLTIREAAEDEDERDARQIARKPTLTLQPEVVDDYVRNFLIRMEMSRTLECFQTEWYELLHKGLIREEDAGLVPDVYSQNSELESEIIFLKQEADKYKNAALKAKEMYIQLRKERDYHRMHHRRVSQEKGKLIEELKRLKHHYEQYEPTLQQVKGKYEVALREKMLARLECERAVGQVSGLQNTLKNVDNLKRSSFSSTKGQVVLDQASNKSVSEDRGLGPTQRLLADMRQKATLPVINGGGGVVGRREGGGDELLNTDDRHRHLKDSEFPIDRGFNPDLNRSGPSGHVARTSGYRLANTFVAHSHPIGGLALHPKTQILATCSDDHSWKMWSLPAGEVIFTGTGHTEWVSDCDFHPTGSTLATTSGDTTVKIWTLAHPGCKHTFTDHSLAVWSCSWHTCGDFIATASMDKTVKVWDVGSLRCRRTLRGHSGSVNCVQFLVYSNTLVTCSADKTLSIWDARTDFCAMSLVGHQNSVNHVTFNARGDTLASCDSSGMVKLWDVRKNVEIVSIDTGPFPANKSSFESTGAVVAVASDDTSVKLYNVANGQLTSIGGHTDAVQCVLFDRNGEYLVSSGSDNTVRVWS